MAQGTTPPPPPPYTASPKADPPPAPTPKVVTKIGITVVSPIVIGLPVMPFPRIFSNSSSGSFADSVIADHTDFPDDFSVNMPMSVANDPLDDRQGWIEGSPMPETSTIQGFNDYPIPQSIPDAHLGTNCCEQGERSPHLRRISRLQRLALSKALGGKSQQAKAVDVCGRRR